jgi:hypothetical protein
VSLDRAFTSELTRRATARLRPPRGPERGPRRATIPSRRSSPSSRSTPPTPTLESEALTLELTRLDREISATRAAATGDVAPLVGRRQDLRDRAIALAMKQTQPAE